jgi:hypothetical protein
MFTKIKIKENQNIFCSTKFLYNRVLQIQSIQSFKGNFTKKIIYADPSFISGKFHEISLENYLG